LQRSERQWPTNSPGNYQAINRWCNHSSAPLLLLKTQTHINCHRGPWSKDRTFARRP